MKLIKLIMPGRIHIRRSKEPIFLWLEKFFDFLLFCIVLVLLLLLLITLSDLLILNF